MWSTQLPWNPELSQKCLNRIALLCNVSESLHNVLTALNILCDFDDKSDHTMSCNDNVNIDT